MQKRDHIMEANAFSTRTNIATDIVRRSLLANWICAMSKSLAGRVAAEQREKLKNTLHSPLTPHYVMFDSAFSQIIINCLMLVELNFYYKKYNIQCSFQENFHNIFIYTWAVWLHTNGRWHLYLRYAKSQK